MTDLLCGNKTLAKITGLFIGCILYKSRNNLVEHKIFIKLYESSKGKDFIATWNFESHTFKVSQVVLQQM